MIENNSCTEKDNFDTTVSEKELQLTAALNKVKQLEEKLK